MSEDKENNIVIRYGQFQEIISAVSQDAIQVSANQSYDLASQRLLACLSIERPKESQIQTIDYAEGVQTAFRDTGIAVNLNVDFASSPDSLSKVTIKANKVYCDAFRDIVKAVDEKRIPTLGVTG